MIDTEVLLAKPNIEILQNELITVEVLLSGTSSQIIALPSKYRFTSISARNAYFAYYSSELAFGTWVLVGDQLYQYNGTEWIDFTTAITGPAGRSLVVKGLLESIEDLPDPSICEPNESYLISGYQDGNHLFIILTSTMEWSDQGSFVGIVGPKGDTGPIGPTGPKGDTGAVPTFLIKDGHLYALYEEEE